MSVCRPLRWLSHRNGTSNKVTVFLSMLKRPSILPFIYPSSTLPLYLIYPSSTLPLYLIFLAVPIVTNSLIRDVYKEQMITFRCVYKVAVKNNKAERKKLFLVFHSSRRSQWPRGLRRRSAAARLLRSWVRITPGGMDVCLL